MTSRRWRRRYHIEPARYRGGLASHIIDYGPEYTPSDRQVQREFYDADRMVEMLEPSERELSTVDVAARYVGTSVSTLEVLCAALYGCKPDQMTRRQSRRTDGLLRLTYYVARESGYEPALRKNPPGGAREARQPADPPGWLEEAA